MIANLHVAQGHGADAERTSRKRKKSRKRKPRKRKPRKRKPQPQPPFPGYESEDTLPELCEASDHPSDDSSSDSDDSDSDRDGCPDLGEVSEDDSDDEDYVEHKPTVKQRKRKSRDHGLHADADIQREADAEAETFCRQVRGVQQRTKCTEATVIDFISTFGKHLKCPTANIDFRKCDVKMQSRAGVGFLILHGCIKCNKFVFTPDDKRTHCPYVKPDGEVCGAARFDGDGKPKERVLYFPLRPKITALMGTKKYFSMCQHEYERPRNSNLLTDVYDSDAWKEFMGPVTYPNKRLGLLFCCDGIPAFAAGTLSLKPAMFMNLSLPPGARSKAKYMILFMLMQQSIKEGQKKYYDFAADFELNDLYHHGTAGVKVKVFSSTMDTKGREELSGACNALHVLCR